MRPTPCYPSIVSLAATAAIACACGIDLPGPPGATATSASTSTTSAEDSSAGDESTSSSSTTTTTATTTTTTTTSAASTGDETSGTTEDVPIDECLETLPSPTDCEPYAAVCGTGTPVAGGGQLYVSGLTLGAGDLWFRASAWGVRCPEAIYRQSTADGVAHRIRSTENLVTFEANDDALYLVSVIDQDLRRVSVLVDGVETDLADTSKHSPLNPVPSPGGLVLYAHNGPKMPSFATLTPTAYIDLGAAVDDAYLGSVPAYDGERLYFSWDDYQGPLHRRLVAHADGVSVSLAENAASRGTRTVAVDDLHVYFVTGDLGNSEPMGVSRVPRGGGPATPLFPPTPDLGISELIIDDDTVYFVHQANHIYAVPKAGGELRHLWEGIGIGRLYADATDLYFHVSAPVGDRFPPGHEFVVRVAKESDLP